MKYKVLYSAKALKQLKKMDKVAAIRITSWIGRNLEGTSDPRKYGKALSGSHAGEWRYRVGNYRILCVIRDKEVVIEVFAIAHRSSAYRER